MDPFAEPFNKAALLSVTNAAAAAQLLMAVPHRVVSTVVTEYVVALFHAVPGARVCFEIDGAGMAVNVHAIDADTSSSAADAESPHGGRSNGGDSSETGRDDVASNASAEGEPRRLAQAAYPYVALPVPFDWHVGPHRRPAPVSLCFRNVDTVAIGALCLRTAVVFEAEHLELHGATPALPLAQMREIDNVLAPGREAYRVPPSLDASGLSVIDGLPVASGFAAWPTLVELKLPPGAAGPMIGDSFFAQHELERLVFHPQSRITSLASSTFCFAYKLRRVDLSVCKFLTTLGSHCFQGCNGLEVVCARGLPRLRSIGACVFLSCTSLRLVDFRDCPLLFTDAVLDEETFDHDEALEVFLCDEHNRATIANSIQRLATRKPVAVTWEAIDVPSAGGDDGAPVGDEWREFECCCGTVRAQCGPTTLTDNPPPGQSSDDDQLSVTDEEETDSSGNLIRGSD